MCLTANKSDYKRYETKYIPITTHEDLEVWKWLGFDQNSFYAPIRSYRYKPGSTYTSIITSEMSISSSFFIVERGLHAYTSLAYAKQSWLAEEWRVLIKFIIPKGSKIFISSSGTEIVSNTITFPVPQFTYRWNGYRNNKGRKINFKKIKYVPNN